MGLRGTGSHYMFATLASRKRRYLGLAKEDMWLCFREKGIHHVVGQPHPEVSIVSGSQLRYN